jgi:hypothetical protein
MNIPENFTGYEFQCNANSQNLVYVLYYMGGDVEKIDLLSVKDNKVYDQLIYDSLVHSIDTVQIPNHDTFLLVHEDHPEYEPARDVISYDGDDLVMLYCHLENQDIGDKSLKTFVIDYYRENLHS